MSNQHTIRSTLTDDVVSKSGFGVIVTTSSRTTWILRRDRKCINFTLKLFELNEAWGKRWRRSHLGCGGFEKAHLLPVRPGAQKPRGISNTQLLGEHLCTYSHHNTTTIIITARSSTHCHGSADERRTPPTQKWTHTRDARAHTLSRYHARKAYRKQLKMVIPSTVLPVNSTCETQHVHRTHRTWHACVSALLVCPRRIPVVVKFVPAAKGADWCVQRAGHPSYSVRVRPGLGLGFGLGRVRARVRAKVRVGLGLGFGHPNPTPKPRRSAARCTWVAQTNPEPAREGTRAGGAAYVRGDGDGHGGGGETLVADFEPGQHLPPEVHAARGVQADERPQAAALGAGALHRDGKRQAQKVHQRADHRRHLRAVCDGGRRARLLGQWHALRSDRVSLTSV